MGNKRYFLTPGQRFTRLEIISETATRNGRRYAICRCDCGTVREFDIYSLFSGHTKSCGCMAMENLDLGRKATDLTNQTFGRLIAIMPVGVRNKCTLWLCECSCTPGKTITVPARDLMTGNTTSCGCALSDHTRSLKDYNEQHHTVDGVFVPLLRQKIQPNNKTGVKGVSISRDKKGRIRYVANITVNNKRIYLGIFDKLEDAEKARKNAEEKYHKPYIDVLSLPPNVIDLRGKKFGRLAVIKYAGKSKWICKCECGEIVNVSGYNLTLGKSKSCGCLRRQEASIRAKKYNPLRRKVRADNKTGVTGVRRLNKQSTKWVAKININGKLIHLGTFKNFDDAVVARKAAEEKYHKPYHEEKEKSPPTN